MLVIIISRDCERLKCWSEIILKFELRLQKGPKIDSKTQTLNSYERRKIVSPFRYGL